MSAEVYGANPQNIRLVGAVGEAVASILKATGVSPAEAHTSGERAAMYAADLLLSTLEMLGHINEGGVSDDHFIEILGQVAEVTIDPSKAYEYFEGQS
jgi:hypothetical protein